VYVKFHF